MRHAAVHSAAQPVWGTQDMLIGLSWVPSSTEIFLLIQVLASTEKAAELQSEQEQEHLCNQDDMQSSVCLGETRDDSIAVVRI